MDNGISKGISFNELIRYMLRHIKGMIVLALIVTSLSGSVLYIKNHVIGKQNTSVPGAVTVIDEARKNVLDKQAKLYLEFWESGYDDPNVPAADRIEAAYQSELIKGYMTDNERVYYDKLIGMNVGEVEKEAVSSLEGRPVSSIVILAIGFGIMTSLVVYMIKCITSTEIHSFGYFSDRYGLSYIPWSNNSSPGTLSDEEISGFLEAEVEGSDIEEVFITGSLLDESDRRLIYKIDKRLKGTDIKVSSCKMDVFSADVIRRVKRAGMIILIEHLSSSNIKLIDEEIKLINENAKETIVKTILMCNTGII